MGTFKNGIKEQVFVSQRVSCNFNLRSPKSRKPTAIFMVVRLEKKQYKIPTGVKVIPDHWSKKLQCAYVGTRLNELENSNNSIANERIEQLNERFSEFLQYLCRAESIGDIKTLKDFLTMGKKKEKEISVIDHFTNWCWDKNDSTRTNYLAKVKWLEKFIGTRADKNTITFNTIATSKFFREFQAWLIVNMKDREGRNVKPDSINKVVGTVLTLLKGAIDMDYISKSDYLNIAVKKLEDKSDVNVPFLYNSEIMKLYRYECEDATDAIVKDVFLLECTTGQRISDIKALAENVQQGENGLLILDLLTKKESTRVRVRILFDIARKILIDKYNYQVPKVGENEINKRIKDIAHRAGITRPWKKTRHEAGDKTGKPKENEKPLYQFITTHVGRHSFDCLLKMRGYSYEDISRYAGHDVDMVKRYTANCTDIDIDDYELTKINHPDDIVKLISEVDAPAVPKDKSTAIEVTPATASLSDMGKIYTFINERINAYVDFYIIVRSTIQYIRENRLSLRWLGSASERRYQSKLQKDFGDNYDEINRVLLEVQDCINNGIAE